MIPKIIHYCWYGKGEFSEEIKMCIASWEKYCPDYEIKRWDESNSPLDIKWVKDAYKYQKYAFMADYVRYYSLYHYGGVYMDTDMLLIKNIDEFLTTTFFLGLEDKENISLGIIGSEKGFYLNKDILDFYDVTKFDMVRPPINTRFLKPVMQKNGFIEEDRIQELDNGVVFFPSDYFYPIPYWQNFELSDISKYCTENTYGVHLWNKSWIKTEFTLFEERKYKDGFKIVFNRIKRTPFLPFGYYKKLAKYIYRFLIGK